MMKPYQKLMFYILFLWAFR